MLSSEKVNFERVGVVPWVDAVVVEYEVAPTPFLDLVSDDRVGIALALVGGGGGVCPSMVFIVRCRRLYFASVLSLFFYFASCFAFFRALFLSG